MQKSDYPERASGLRCPQCGAATSVSETRAIMGGGVLRRSRRCETSNGHAFSTYEIHGSAWLAVRGLVKDNSVALQETSEVYDRNLKMVRQVLRGVQVKEVSRVNGIEASTLSNILRTFGIRHIARHKVSQQDLKL